ncbi:MAG: thioredoxin family protein [Candidatus Thorarchaeota archaeon]|nr:MAG: thioredoxin family protein [Candidatus Thorarchaeota archaeon]
MMTEADPSTQPTLADVTEDCPDCTTYIQESMKTAYRGGFKRAREYYHLKVPVVEKLREYENDYTIVAIFADWCGDARKVIPVLSLLEEQTNFEIRALGGMVKPPYGEFPKRNWAVPPSPVEVDTFGITSSPTIIIFRKDTGKEIGRIKTRPRMTNTVEDEILKIIEDSLKEEQ